MKECLNSECNNNLPLGVKYSSIRKYCSSKCQKRSGYLRFINNPKNKNYSKLHYIKNKERHLEYVKKWHNENSEKARKSHEKAAKKFRENNREKFNKIILNNYYQNKDKWNSRSYTNKILKNKKYGGTNPLNKECKKCSSTKNLEIHHEIYSVKIEEIKKSIEEGKIYYLCRKCHGRGKNHFGNLR